MDAIDHHGNGIVGDVVGIIVDAFRFAVPGRRAICDDAVTLLDDYYAHCLPSQNDVSRFVIELGESSQSAAVVSSRLSLDGFIQPLADRIVLCGGHVAGATIGIDCVSDFDSGSGRTHERLTLESLRVTITDNQSDLILDVENVWKIYCRNLKRAMWYGLRDLGREVAGAGRDRTQSDLRPGEFFAVRDASFQVRRGECVAMIGPNGAGKSTMLKLINGLVKPDAGKITIHGKIGALIELGTGFNPILSGRENVYINGSVLGLKKREIDGLFDTIVDFAELGHVINDPVKTYSSGMRMRLGFSVAANLRPQLLLMDEVLAVGDVGFRMKCFAHLRKLVDQGVSIILVTHAVGMLQRVASRAIVFGNGKIIHDGDLETGCTIYEETLGASDRNQDTPSESADQRANIESVAIINAQGQPQLQFNTGETVCVQVKLNCRQPVKHARLVVALCSAVHGTLTSVSTPHQNVEFDLESPGRVITLSFPAIPLLIGAYHFNVSLMGPAATDFYHRSSGRGLFRIVGPPVNASGFGINGIVSLEHRWDVSE